MANETSPTPKQDVDGAVAIFTALADPARLRLLVHMARGEAAVSDLAVATGGRLTTVSARLRVLLSARLVARRRDGRSVLYRLADAHVLMLVSNALDHARETRRP
ncbi:ArsR/SmtB family transcription factor [Aureimonas endophytica]|uniref:ArsR/SmtB family transcription factor n=1 Tax=Aureimonas endophytica TaxID=2027858 RepID=UPI001FCEB51A|nr:metalloregulator ArsR/SmtB family transcription factor [Aureimonas endophytica]